MGKSKFSQSQKRMRQWVFSACGIQTGLFAIILMWVFALSHFYHIYELSIIPSFPCELNGNIHLTKTQPLNSEWAKIAHLLKYVQERILL